jgi:Protein of unknown function (DUF1071)
MTRKDIIMSKYAERRKIDVSEHIEKKNGLSYLSWAWAVDTLLLHDETANWEYVEPIKFNNTLMVQVKVHAFGTTRKCLLPVMNHRNQAVDNPDAFQVNTAYMRCLAKAIAMHGIGLYIYNGEDLPPSDDAPAKLQPEDVAQIEKIASKAKVEISKICEGYNVQSLSDIPASQYGKIISNLTKRVVNAVSDQ